MSKIETVILDNGLRIYLYVDKKRHSTFFQHITLFGGRDKDFEFEGKTYHVQDGIAHILEHYIVEENARGNFLKMLGEQQMTTNASTEFDRTSFYFDAVEKLEYGIETIIRGIYSPVFDEERLEKIKKPILQEVRGKLGNKFFQNYLAMLDNVFKEIKVRSIGGSLEDISNTTLDDIKTCFNAFYQPSNQIILIGGNFDKKSVLDLIKKLYKELNIKKKEFRKIIPNEVDEVNRKKGIIEFPTGQEYSEVNVKLSLKNFTPDEKLKLDFYFHFFQRMFFGNTSKLYKELVEKNIITTSLVTDRVTFYDYIILSVGSYSDYKEKLEEMIIDTFKKLDDFDEEFFEIMKKETILQIVLRSENLYNTLVPFIENVIRYDCQYPDSVQMIESFTFEDFKKTIKNFDFSNMCISTIINKTE